MIQIICGSDRVHSKSKQVADIVKANLQNVGAKVEIIDLHTLPLHTVEKGKYSDGILPDEVAQAVSKVNSADGLVVIAPEYNGSMPGALKYFIDHWSYPKSFEYRPVAFVGLGGRFGGLRPVEHLQGVFGYRNSFMFPIRVFLMNIWDTMKDGKLTDQTSSDLLQQQADGFVKFIAGLKSQGLDANSR